MVTLRNLYIAFGHDPKWRKLATQSAQPMVSVFMRKLGDSDITTLTDFDLEMQLAMSEQPEDCKTKARSCMHYLLRWAKEHGKEVPQIAHPFEMKEQETKNEKDNDNSDKRQKIVNVDNHNNRQRRIPPTYKHHKTAARNTKQFDTKRDKVKSAARSKTGRKSDENVTKPKREKPEKVLVQRPTKEGDTRRRRGTIYHDDASNGYSKAGKRVFKDCWRAEIMIAGQRFRHRSKDREDCVAWLKAVKQGKIKPTDNKADWWRMEQHKDEEARIDELIVSAAEEANIVYEYRQTGDTEILYNYCIKALLPHMVYYCAHSLHLGRDRSLTCARQAVGLILTKIVGGRPVTNITFTCKRMLRTYKNRGDFWYYEKAPEAVKLMVNRIDMSALADLYKVIKDKRI